MYESVAAAVSEWELYDSVVAAGTEDVSENFVFLWAVAVAVGSVAEWVVISVFANLDVDKHLAEAGLKLQQRAVKEGIQVLMTFALKGNFVAVA